MMEEQVQLITDNYTTFIKVLLILAGTALLAKVVNTFYKKFLQRNSERNDEHLTTYKFLEHVIYAGIYLSGISFAISFIPFLRPVAQSLLAGAGIIAIAVGFAAQQSLGNIVSGVFIVISKPYRINDRISMSDGQRGIVEDISLRHTVIRNFENQRIIIPNSIISNQVLINSNYADSKVCKLLTIGISYESDIDLAKHIIREEAEAHPLVTDNRSPEDKMEGIPIVMVRVILLNESSVDLRAWVWANSTADGFVLECDVLESVKKRFDREGIVIPFPQRTVSYLKPSKESSDQPNS